MWTENLSLPAVLNECMLQSYDGVIRPFPNATNLGKTRFRDLRAAGALLVSAAWDGKAVAKVELKSEKGSRVRILNPWARRKVAVRESSGAAVAVTMQQSVLEFSTVAGATYALRPA